MSNEITKKDWDKANKVVKRSLVSTMKQARMEDAPIFLVDQFMILQLLGNYKLKTNSSNEEVLNKVKSWLELADELKEDGQIEKIDLTDSNNNDKDLN